MNLSRRNFFAVIGKACAVVAASSVVPAPVSAFINRHRPHTWDEIVTTTLQNRSSYLAANVMRNNALLRRLSQKHEI